MSSIIALRRRAALKKQNTNENASKNIIAHYSDEPITSIIEKKLPESIEKPNIKDDDVLDIEREKNKSLNNISNDNKMIKTSIYPQDDIEIDNEIITAMESGDISDKILKNEKLKMTHARINDAKISPEIKGVMRSLAAYGYNEDNCPPITQTMGPMETIEDRSTFLELMHTIIVANFKSLLKTPKQSSNIDSNSTQYHSRRRYRGEHVLGGQHGNMPTKGRTYQMGQNPRSR